MARAVKGDVGCLPSVETRGMTDDTRTPIPDDDPRRDLVITRVDDPDLPHVGMVGDTYTVVISGADTAGAYTLIDMIVPPGGGPGPHRHDFEELFLVQSGAVEFTFRGRTQPARAGDVVNIPANAPHRFQNPGSDTAHLLCLCTPAAQDEFFLEVGDPLPSRDSAAPQKSPDEMAAWAARAAELAPRFRTELLS